MCVGGAAAFGGGSGGGGGGGGGGSGGAAAAAEEEKPAEEEKKEEEEEEDDGAPAHSALPPSKAAGLRGRCMAEGGHWPARRHGLQPVRLARSLSWRGAGRRQPWHSGAHAVECAVL